MNSTPRYGIGDIIGFKHPHPMSHFEGKITDIHSLISGSLEYEVQLDSGVTYYERDESVIFLVQAAVARSNPQPHVYNAPTGGHYVVHSGRVGGGGSGSSINSPLFIVGSTVRIVDTGSKFYGAVGTVKVVYEQKTTGMHSYAIDFPMNPYGAPIRLLERELRDESGSHTHTTIGRFSSSQAQPQTMPRESHICNFDKVYIGLSYKEDLCTCGKGRNKRGIHE